MVLKMVRSALVGCISLLLVLGAPPTVAGPIDPASYTSVNNMYWTNHDLGLDIVRLTWADTLGGTGSGLNAQATKTDVDNWLTANAAGGWNWANNAQFASVYNWFDTDPLQDHTWSTDQNTGSSLFIALNGTGPGYASSNNGGYSSSGQIDWTMMSKTESVGSSGLRVGIIADFGSQALGITCTDTYCDDGSDPRGYHDSDWATLNLVYAAGDFYLGTTAGNYAALIVRETSSQPVPTPGTSIFLLGGILLLLRSIGRSKVFD